MDKAVISYQEDYCKECMRIACKKCDWVATDEEVIRIQKNKLTACPQCGWKPK